MAFSSIYNSEYNYIHFATIHLEQYHSPLGGNSSPTHEKWYHCMVHVGLSHNTISPCLMFWQKQNLSSLYGEEHSSKHLGKSREEVGMSSALEEENDMQASGVTSWRDCKSDTDESIGGM